MMRSLNMIATPPYPPHSGGDLRAWNLCRHLAPKVQQTVLCRVMGALPSTDTTGAFAHHHIGLSTVNIPRPSALKRVCKGLRHSWSPYPIMQAGWDHASMHRRLHQLLKTYRYDVIVLDGSMLCSYIPDLASTDAIKVVNLYDLQPLLLRRLATVLPLGGRKLCVMHDAWKMQRTEASMLQAADLILVTSERERQTLVAQDPDYRVAVVPNGVDCKALQPLPPSSAQELLFVGSLQYHPNVEAILDFVSQVWPALRARFPSLQFRIVGRAPPTSILALDHQAGIRVMGEVPDVTPYYLKATLSVVPLRVGGGTRLKILESMALGRPVVSTTIGCEGLDTIHGKHLLIANGAEDTVAQVSRVLSDSPLYAQLRSEGRALVEAQYDWREIADALYGHYETLIASHKRNAEVPDGHGLQYSQAVGAALASSRN